MTGRATARVAKRRIATPRIPPSERGYPRIGLDGAEHQYDKSPCANRGFEERAGRGSIGDWLPEPLPIGEIEDDGFITVYPVTARAVAIIDHDPSRTASVMTTSPRKSSDVTPADTARGAEASAAYTRAIDAPGHRFGRWA